MISYFFGERCLSQNGLKLLDKIYDTWNVDLMDLKVNNVNWAK